jgi:hypothetical protein
MNSEDYIELIYEDIHQIRHKMSNRFRGYKLILQLHPKVYNILKESDQIGIYDARKDTIMSYKFILDMQVKDFKVLVDLLGD